MTVSTGFNKKIQKWVLNEHGEVAFQPFKVDGNPYKSKIFLVSSTPEPCLSVDPHDLRLHIDSLADSAIFQELYFDELKSSSREYKGCLNFVAWAKEQLGENVVLSYINCLYTESPQQLKLLKKQNDPIYHRGLEVSKLVLNEFSPKILIVQGTTAWKYFLERFESQLIDFNSKDLTVQQLESIGTVAKLQLENGDVVNILVCRSMGYFGKGGTSFTEFKNALEQLL
ncbi:hypothetical protein SAMN05880501_11548 [Ureibacillus xyleni]|uniref:Uracil DNA glycosylase superfamily protein n=1 Tax=Ureibacillus xyleni TaxID=614648 RepID=A0A285TLA3_9BACL|nr:hypothetical protein [Ureibacillus xyleni]SOC23318.1 hypothetical protein SAMN05880501_11548 [Ureibacillus xyleni]